MAHPTLLTLDEAAERLTIARKTLRDWLKTDPPKLRGVKIGREWRVLEADVEGYIARAIGPQPSDALAPIDREPELEDLKPDQGPLHLVSKGQVPTETMPMAPPKALTGTRAQIVEALRAHPAGLTPVEVQAQLGTDKPLRDTMHGMLKKGILRRTDDHDYGRYVVAEGW